MRIFDCHVHCPWGDAGKAGAFLDTLDKAGYEAAVVFSPAPERHEKGPSAKAQKESVDVVVDFASADRDRIIPFARIAPQVEGAVDAVKYAKDKGCVGIKMLPNQWYPYDRDILFPVYEAVQEAGMPIIFHSGILYAYEDTSRFCRPAYYEAMLHFPKVKFALAHISWPWTDECVATFGRMRSYARQNKLEQQMYIDCTQGTPRFYRSNAMDKAIKFCSCDWLLFGTDARVTSPAGTYMSHFHRDMEILADEFKRPAEDLEKFFCSNLLRFLGME